MKLFIAFFQQLSCLSYGKGSARRHLRAQTAFSMTSRLQQQYVQISEFRK